MANDKSEYKVSPASFKVQMDRNVIVTFLVFSVISILVIAIKLFTFKECHIIEIKLNSAENKNKNSQNVFYSDEPINFIANTKNGKSYIWDFGDGSPKIKSQSSTHYYHKPGIYQIKVLVDGRCDEYVDANILNNSLNDDELKTAIKNNKPYIVGASSVEVNQPITFSDPTSSVSWEWTVLGEKVPVQTGQSATYTFAVPGEKIIMLKANGDLNRTTEKTILVTASTQSIPAPTAMLPKQMPPPAMPDNRNQFPANNQMPPMPTQRMEEEPKVEKPVIKYYTDNDYKDMLEDITYGNAKLDELLPKLCAGKATKFYINDSFVSWNSVTDQLKGKSIKNIDITREKNNKNCVTAFAITL